MSRRCLDFLVCISYLLFRMFHPSSGHLALLGDILQKQLLPLIPSSPLPYLPFPLFGHKVFEQFYFHSFMGGFVHKLVLSFRRGFERRLDGLFFELWSYSWLNVRTSKDLSSRSELYHRRYPSNLYKTIWTYPFIWLSSVIHQFRSGRKIEETIYSLLVDWNVAMLTPLFVLIVLSQPPSWLILWPWIFQHVLCKTRYRLVWVGNQKLETSGKVPPGR